MGEELQVIVQQEPGVVKWNFEQLKANLAEMMSSYEMMVYDDSSIVTARQDLAGLRKLRGAVEDKRKEIRRKCLEPYSVIEGQAKELTTLIDKPIAVIDGQVKAYEEARRKEKRDAIAAYMAEAFADLPANIGKRLQCKIYSPAWENASTPKKTWMDAITAAHDQTMNELDIIGNVDEDFRDMAMEVYGKGLVLAEALQKVNELQRQREIIRQREQERREAEARRREAEEKARQEREAAIKAAQEAPAPVMENPKPEPVKAEQNIQKPVPTPPQTPPQAAQAQPVKAQDGTVEKVLRIRGNENQIARILGFIKYAGAAYEEVNA